MDPLRELGRVLLILGAVIVIVGALLYFGARLPFRLGRLPGDIIHRGEHTTFYFPIVSCLAISFVLSFILWLFANFRRCASRRPSSLDESPRVAYPCGVGLCKGGLFRSLPLSVVNSSRLPPPPLFAAPNSCSRPKFDHSRLFTLLLTDTRATLPHGRPLPRPNLEAPCPSTRRRSALHKRSNISAC